LSSSITDRINEFFVPAVEILNKIIFWDLAKAIGLELPYEVPFVVVWLMLGGLKSIARVTSKIIPFMAILYVVTSLVIIFMNYNKLLFLEINF